MADPISGKIVIVTGAANSSQRQTQCHSDGATAHGSVWHRGLPVSEPAFRPASRGRPGARGPASPECPAARAGARLH
jgi:hypothetical protein